MNKDELKLLVSIMEQMILMQRLQIASTKDFSSRFKVLHQLAKLRSELDKQGEIAIERREQFNATERDFEKSSADAERKLFTAMARLESNHEQQEHFLEILKASLNNQS